MVDSKPHRARGRRHRPNFDGAIHNVGQAETFSTVVRRNKFHAMKVRVWLETELFLTIRHAEHQNV